MSWLIRVGKVGGFVDNRDETASRAFASTCIVTTSDSHITAQLVSAHNPNDLLGNKCTSKRSGRPHSQAEAAWRQVLASLVGV